MIFFEIDGRMPGLNEIIGMARKHPMASAHQKKKSMKVVKEAVEAAGLANVRLRNPFTVEFTWVEKDSRRDPDNIQAGAKFILDALVEMGLIEDDDQKHVRHISNEVIVDKGYPRVEVRLKEIGEHPGA